MTTVTITTDHPDAPRGVPLVWVDGRPVAPGDVLGDGRLAEDAVAELVRAWRWGYPRAREALSGEEALRQARDLLARLRAEPAALAGEYAAGLLGAYLDIIAAALAEV